jgi:hypothetical protein
LRGVSKALITPINLEYCPGDYETIPFSIKTFLDLHPDWVMMQINIQTFLIVFFELLFLKN